MKIKYAPQSNAPYIVQGVKTCEQGGSSCVINMSYTVKPDMPSFLTSHQKIKLIRNTENLPVYDSPVCRFIKDSSVLLNEFELLTDNRAVPYSVVDYKKIWKKWIELMHVLNSKYEGEWVDTQIDKMTYKISEEKRLLKAILNDFILNELFLRDIYNIAFDKKTTLCLRTRVETALGMPLIFKQSCKFTRTREYDTLQISGEIDMTRKENVNNIIRFCSVYGIAPEKITGIKQKTVYSAFNLENLPDKIESLFTVEGSKQECMREVKIKINIKGAK